MLRERHGGDHQQWNEAAPWGVRRPMQPIARLGFVLPLALAFACKSPPAPQAEAAKEAKAAEPAENAESTPTPAPTIEDQPTTGVHWQQLADAALASADEPGALVILDATSGKVLAKSEREGRVPHPLESARHPASSIKPFVYLAALAEGHLEDGETFPCTGPKRYGEHELECFQDHGDVDLERAVRTSCNHFAYALADRFTLEQLNGHLATFGFGDSPGHVPTEKGMAEAVGHGDMTATPLQIARAYARLARGFTGDDSPYRPEDLERVRKALATTVSHREGTAHGLHMDGLGIAGKTGTATLEPSDEDDAKYLSIFASWAPAEDPEIVVVVQLESTEAGGKAAEALRPVYEALRATLDD